VQFRTALARENFMEPLLQLDTLAPLEFLDRLQRTTYQEPERALMLAVLRDAITCIEKYVERQSVRNRRDCEEALQWIRAEDSEWLFSFENICEALGVNPAYLRRGLIAMSRRDGSPHGKPAPGAVRSSRSRAA
jgi:hypothetical protein